MPLDRQSIEKRDFPISRRGYETTAVDEHLAAVAREVEELQQRADAPTPAAPAPPASVADPGVVSSLASAASEQVRAIVQAAETTAVEIERQARGEAARITGDADTEARRTRESASSDAEATRSEAAAAAQGHVSTVQQATTLMLQRVEALEGEVTGLLEHLRTAAHRVQADLALLHGQVAEVGGLEAAPVAPPTPRPAPQPVAVERPAAPPAPAAEPRIDPGEAVAAEPHVDPESPTAGTEVVPSTPAAPPARQTSLDDAGSGGGDAAGARLVALNMVLDGTPREEVDRYLAENYDLADRAGLLDELYSRHG
ncbi:hypothetical protein SK069_03125 [Patulibacter brassicae]|uniref:Antigen 84 n=1 Tax=Patulibacter brassicae TaxID=1705717 RepID=A0ABU4VI34_9ACTN|nr:hypothetical protein [Patulibacter brassicae]MDX8150573.1 hypothetical protein [Patulibacter brassicae]